MPNSAATADLTIGFLHIQRDDAHSYLGGHLVLNSRGRPLEFRCTASVQPSRAQQVLYGATLETYLRSDVIAPALFQNTRTQPQLIFTSDADNMEARQHVDVPLVWVPHPANDQPAEAQDQCELHRHWRCDEPAGLSGPRWVPFALARQPVSTLAEFADDRQRCQELWADAYQGLDLTEPFQRIGEALREAQRG